VFDPIIQVENLSKLYRIGLREEIHESLVSAVVSLMKRPLMNLQRLRKLSTFGENDDESEDTIWALKDVSFEVQQGEVLGIIGHNGAGKSTLLKILSRITEPTKGEAKIYGRVSSLLEVGTGFNPELTGRENIYLNGAILGMRKTEIDRRFCEIVDFAEIDRFVDTPVKRYSSGMYVRLAFAVAAHLEPEILLVDEVLAVGDAAFQQKCLGKMGDVAKEGRTVLFVSHNMSAVNTLCQSAIMLQSGQIAYHGNVADTITCYLENVHGGNRNPDHTKASSVAFPEDPAKPLQVRKVSLTNAQGQKKSCFDYQENVVVNITFDLRVPNRGYLAALLLRDVMGNVVFFSSDDDLHEPAIGGLAPGQYSYQVKLPSYLLKPGRYYFTITLNKKGRVGPPLDRRDSLPAIEITDLNTRRGIKKGFRKAAVVAPEIPWSLT